MRTSRVSPGAIEEISKLYEIGRQSLELLTDFQSLGATKDEAEQRGISLGRLYTARQFAEKYDKRQFDELVELLERHPSALFSEAHVRLLVPLKKIDTRAELQCSCIENGWTVKRLGQEVRYRLGRRDARGGRPKIIDDQHELLLILRSKVRDWCRWFDGAVRPGAAFVSLSQQFQQKLKKATDRLRDLAEPMTQESRDNRRSGKKGKGRPTGRRSALTTAAGPAPRR